MGPETVYKNKQQQNPSPTDYNLLFFTIAFVSSVACEVF